ncbi:MAG TPA: hypothetical protein VFV59_08755 [Candidatus Limnocylindria bacterium]|nr:hypothetical protein [Candidatus Limnocylindria bacterium]
MTVQQHAPRLEQVRAPVAISRATLIAAAVVVLVVLAIVAAWALLQPTPLIDEFTVQDQQLFQLRDALGGFI